MKNCKLIVLLLLSALSNVAIANTYIFKDTIPLFRVIDSIDKQNRNTNDILLNREVVQKKVAQLESQIKQNRVGLRIDSIIIRYEGRSNVVTDDITLMQSKTRYDMARVSFNASLANVPFNASYQYQRMEGWLNPLQARNAPIVSFDREQFVINMSKRVRESINPNSLLGDKIAAIQNLKSLALKDIQAEIGKILTEYGKEMKDKLSVLNNWDKLIAGDVGYFTKQLLGENAHEQLLQNQQTIAQYQEKINNGQLIDKQAYETAINNVEKTKKLQRSIETIVKFKKKWEESGLVQLVKKLELDKQMQMDEIFKDPAVFAKIAKEKLSLRKLEKLFLKINRLETGMGANDVSPMTLNQSLRSNGINLETIGGSRGNNNSFNLVTGRLPELVSVAEQSIAQGSQFSASQQMMSLGFTRSDANTGEFSRFSIASFAESSQGTINNMMSPITGTIAKNIVFTVSKKIKIGSKGSLLTELSKSAMGRRDEEKQGGQNSGDQTAGAMPGLNNLFNANDFFSNIGLSVEYNNEFPSQNLSHEFRFLYAGKAYSNQGNSFVMPGTKELSNGFRKLFLNKKLTVVIKNKFRQYNLGERVTKHQSHVFDVRWKLDKSNYLALKYQPATGSNTVGGDLMSHIRTQRLAADLNMKSKLLKNDLFNFVNLAYLTTQTMVSGLPSDRYKNIQLTSTHALSKGTNQIFVNTNLSYALQTGTLPLFNSSFLLESGISYDLKGVKLTSALNYNTVDDWYSQIVFKQSVSGKLGRRIEINVGVDAAKNIKVLQPYPVWGSRVDVSFIYLIQ